MRTGASSFYGTEVVIYGSGGAVSGGEAAVFTVRARFCAAETEHERRRGQSCENSAVMRRRRRCGLRKNESGLEKAE